LDDVTEKLKMTEVMKMLDKRARRLEERPREEFLKKSAEEAASREKAAMNQFQKSYKKKMIPSDEMKRATQYLDEDMLYRGISDEIGDTVKFLPKEETLKSLTGPSAKKASKMAALKNLTKAGVKLGKTGLKKGLSAGLGLGGLLIQDDVGAPAETMEGRFERGDTSPEVLDYITSQQNSNITNMDLEEKRKERVNRAKRILAGENNE